MGAQENACALRAVRACVRACVPRAACARVPRMRTCARSLRYDPHALLSTFTRTAVPLHPRDLSRNEAMVPWGFLCVKGVNLPRCARVHDRETDTAQESYHAQSCGGVREYT